VKQNKIKETEEHNFIPEAMPFYRQVDSAAFFNEIHPGKKEYAANTVEINKWQPGIEK
jgi:hypothetical protein